MKIHPGLTHPQIHVDYYKWLSGLSAFDQNFLKKATPEGIAMWAWSRSRETLRATIDSENQAELSSALRSDSERGKE